MRHASDHAHPTNHHDHHARHDHHAHTGHGGSLRRLSLTATLHCMIGCGIGEVLGLVIGTSLGWSNGPTIALAVALAYVFGFGLTMRPLLKAGLGLGRSVRLALQADFVSVTIMEIVDNAIMLAIPGAMDAPLSSLHFWGSLAAALAIAALVAWPVNAWLIARGKGHAVVHAHH